MQNEKKKKERNRELVQEGQHPNTGMEGAAGGAGNRNKWRERH